MLTIENTTKVTVTRTFVLFFELKKNDNCNRKRSKSNKQSHSNKF